MHRRPGPIALGCCLLLLMLAGILLRASQLCDGHFGYPIDDTYIHMAMAKNFAAHGVWGVTPYAFSSSTSSPLFTMLLAATYWISGVHDASPLILNLLFAFALIAWCCFVLRSAGLSARAVLGSVVLLIMVIPLYALTLVGMEHVLHALLSLMFAHLAARMLSGDNDRLLTVALLTLTPFLVMARYEGAFLALAAGILFLLRGRWGLFAGLGFLAASPLAAYAAISIQHGWSAVPNSLLLKANLPNQTHGGLREFVISLARNCLTAPHLPLLLMLALGLLSVTWQKHRGLWTYPGLTLFLFLAAGTLHLLFARVGWYFRYEAYLVAFGGVACLVAASDLSGAVSTNWRRAGIAVTALLLLALGVRTARSIYLTPRGIRNIYDQQYQSARFIRQFYNSATVVVNDIGAVCYLTDARVLDPIGLGDMESARARFQGRYSSQWLGAWARKNGATVAIVYPDVQPPADWPLMGAWSIPDRWIVGRDQVNVYALNTAIVPRLTEQLRTFQAELPRGVRWKGL